MPRLCAPRSSSSAHPPIACGHQVITAERVLFVTAVKWLSGFSLKSALICPELSAVRTASFETMPWHPSSRIYPQLKGLQAWIGRPFTKRLVSILVYAPAALRTLTSSNSSLLNHQALTQAAVAGPRQAGVGVSERRLNNSLILTDIYLNWVHLS
jgi:hypothetical protein